MGNQEKGVKKGGGLVGSDSGQQGRQICGKQLGRRTVVVPICTGVDLAASIAAAAPPTQQAGGRQAAKGTLTEAEGERKLTVVVPI